MLLLLLLKKVKLDEARFNRSGAFFVLSSPDLQPVKVKFWFSLYNVINQARLLIGVKMRPTVLSIFRPKSFSFRKISRKVKLLMRLGHVELRNIL